MFRLTAELFGGRTILSHLERCAPFVAGAVSHRRPDGRAELIVQQTGPGHLAGDRLRIEIAVEAGARLVVRGQSATRLFSCPAGTWIELTTRIRVAAGGELIYLPGELIPFRDAELRQTTEIEVAAGGRCAVAEIVTGGRLATGERDAYRRLDLRLRAQLAGKLLLVERTGLEPAVRPLSVPGRLGRFPIAASLIVIRPTTIHIESCRSDDAIVACGGSDDLLVMRAVAARTELCRSAVERIALAALA